jgi:hypothetical protein
MGAAIGDIFGLAAGVAGQPLPILAIILMLVTPRGRTNGVPFAVGRLAVLGTAVLLLAGPADTATDRGAGRAADSLVWCNRLP